MKEPLKKITHTNMEKRFYFVDVNSLYEDDDRHISEYTDEEFKAISEYDYSIDEFVHLYNMEQCPSDCVYFMRYI